MMKRFCILTLSLTLMLGCSRPGLIERRVGEKVEGCKPGAPCVIRIAAFTDFEWDRMYAFSYGAELSDIEAAIGTSFPNYVQFTRRLVFLKGGRIVYREDEPTDIERPVDGEVSFAEAESYPVSSHWAFTPETAVFSAEKKEFDGGAYYALKQVK